MPPGDDDGEELALNLTAVFHHGQGSVDCEARVDGFKPRIFKLAHGEPLGLDIESTVAEHRDRYRSFKAHLHTVTIEVLGIRSEAIV